MACMQKCREQFFAAARKEQILHCRRVEDSERSYIRRLLITVAVVALALAAWQLRFVLLLLFGAVLVAVIIRAIANPIARVTHAPEKLALLGTVLSLIAAAVGVAWLFGDEAATQVRALGDTLPRAWGTVEQRLGDTRFSEWLAQAQPEGSAILAGAGGIAVTLGNGIAGALLALIGGIYLAAAPSRYVDGALDLVPQSKRALLREAFETSGRALRLWLLGQLGSMMMIGLLTALGLWLIGVPSALALGLLAALAAFVPYLGPILSAVPALLIALNEGSQEFLLTLALYVAVQQVESYVVTPLIQQRVATLPAALTVFAIVAAGLLLGTPGILLAAPLTMVAYVLVKRLYVEEALDTPTEIPGEDG
jgi:predicted PurR-regulated permease PerM